MRICDLVDYLSHQSTPNKTLIDALIDLDNLVGMAEVKRKITSIVCHAVIFNDQSNYNVVIYGKPGVGKTLIINILARIYAAIRPMPQIKTCPNTHLNWWLRFIKEQMEESVADLRATDHDSDVYLRLDWTHKTCQDLERYFGTTEQPPLIATPKIVYIRRAEVVGKWQGHSAPNTLDKLNEGKGGVIVIDEGYSLINGEGDDFGSESLNVINQFITENPDTRFILAGYKDRIERTIFDAQEGLKSRFPYKMEIVGYTGHELATMAIRRLNITHEDNVTEKWLGDLITTNIKRFPAFGRSVEEYHLLTMISVAERSVNERISPGNAVVKQIDYIVAIDGMPEEDQCPPMYT